MIILFGERTLTLLVQEGRNRESTMFISIRVGTGGPRSRRVKHWLFCTVLINRGIPVDFHTYVKVLQIVCKTSDLVAGKQVHDHIVKSGLEPNIYLVNNLIKMYISCGLLGDARKLFDKLVKKDVFTWTILIGGYAQHNHGAEAFEVFRQMLQEGPEPNSVTYLSILKACASPVTLERGREVHAHIMKAGLLSDVRVGNALVNMYAKSGSVEDARKVFDKMAYRNVITWNVMIRAYAESGHGEEAFTTFQQMLQEGLGPNAITYLSILNPCAITGALEWVKEVHAQAHEAGVETDVRVGNAFINMYAKCGSIKDARQVFDKMVTRDEISWTAMIGAYAGSGHSEEAFENFLQMRQEGFEPDAITYLSILNPCASPGALELVKRVHAQALKAGLESDVRVVSALVNMYAKCGSIEDARKLFDKMVKRDVISWNVMIGAYAESGQGDEAFKTFLQMRQKGMVPNAITYLSILNPCASPGAMEWVKEVHVHAFKAGLESDVRVGNAFINMYAKCGSIKNARQAFDKMVNRDVLSWSGMIGAYAGSGQGEKGLCNLSPNAA